MTDITNTGSIALPMPMPPPIPLAQQDEDMVQESDFVKSVPDLLDN